MSKSKLSGEIRIPGSKSHTIRGILLAGFSGGTCELQYPLFSPDTEAALDAIKSWGASYTIQNDRLLIQGLDLAEFSRQRSFDNQVDYVIDCQNSGTTLYLATALACLSPQFTMFDGDNQLRKRSAAPLLQALKQLGAEIDLSDSCCPYRLRGSLSSGEVRIECLTSQFLSALLLTLPLCRGQYKIVACPLYERPYIQISLDWLTRVGLDVNVSPADYLSQLPENPVIFTITGGQKIKPFVTNIPADWSSAAFPIVAAVITNSSLTVQGLSMQDSQGDKAILRYLEVMGGQISCQDNSVQILPRKNALQGVELDLSNTPDALPIVAVAAAFGQGQTRIINVKHARQKETDRIAVMAQELTRLGVDVQELADGLVINGCGAVRGGDVSGHGDHRVIMALAVAGLVSDNLVVIDNVAAAAITYPTFITDMKNCGAAFKY